MLDFLKEQLESVENDLKSLISDKSLAGIGTEDSYELVIQRKKRERESLLNEIKKEEDLIKSLLPAHLKFDESQLSSVLEQVQEQLALNNRRTDLSKLMTGMNGLFDFTYDEFMEKIKEGDVYHTEFDPKNYINNLFNEILYGNNNEKRSFSGKLLPRTKLDIQEIRDDKYKFRYWERSVIVSGITLSLAIEFEIEKVNLLISFVNDREPLVWKKALVGLFLVLNKNSRFVLKDDDLKRKLRNLQTQPDIQEALISLGLALETFEEDFDFMIKFSSGVKLHDYMEFFELPQHWFIPFYENNAVLEKSNIEEPLKTLLTHSVSWMIDAFKFAFCENYNNYWDWQKDKVVKILQNENHELKNANINRLRLDYRNTDHMKNAYFEEEARQYLHQLSYFFFAFPRDKFKSLFEEKVKIFNSQIFDFISTTQTQNSIKAEVFYNMGNAYSAKGDKDKAIKCYQKAIGIKPDKHEAFYNMGNAYSAKGDKDKAIECYQKAIDIKPDNHEFYGSWGFTLIKFGEIKKAESVLLKAIELGNKDIGFMNLGHVYMAEGDTEKALFNYMRSFLAFSNKDIFWEGMKDDFQYLKQYGITQQKYELILKKMTQESFPENAS